jgi:muramidase (phage lysozyme)
MVIAPGIKSFLDLIGFSEGADYDTIVTGVDGPHIFTDFSDHPFAPQFHRPPVQWRMNPPSYSTASGRYQVLYHWWAAYKAELHLSDFSPASQDAYAIQILKERGAIPLIVEGNIQGAIIACHGEWESFPGGVVQGNGPHTMGALLQQYEVFFGDRGKVGSTL